MSDTEDVIGPGVSMYWTIHKNEEEEHESPPLEKKEVDKRDLCKKSEEQMYWVFKTSINAIKKFLPKEITTSQLIENAEIKPKKLGNRFHERNLDYLSKRRIEKLRTLPPLYNFDRTTMKEHIKFYNSKERKTKSDPWLRADTELTTPPGNKYFENQLLKEITRIQKLMNVNKTKKRNEVTDEKIRHILITLTKEIKNELKRQSELIRRSIYMNQENTTSVRQYKALEFDAIHERLESWIELADYLNMNNKTILETYPSLRDKEKEIYYEDEDSRLERINKNKPVQKLEIKPLNLEPPPPQPLQSPLLNNSSCSSRSSFNFSNTAITTAAETTNNNNNNMSINNTGCNSRPISPLVPEGSENSNIDLTNSSSSLYYNTSSIINNNNNSKELIKPSSPLCNTNSLSVPSTESSSDQQQSSSTIVQQQLQLLQSSSTLSNNNNNNSQQLNKPRKSLLQQSSSSRKSIHSSRSRSSPLLLPYSSNRSRSPSNKSNSRKMNHEKKALLKKSDKLLAEIANIPKMHQLMPIEEMGSHSLSSIPSKQLSSIPSRTDKLEFNRPTYNGHGPSLIVDETDEILRKAHFTIPKFMPPQENTMVLCTKEQKDYAELKRSKMSYSPIFYQYYGERSFEEKKLPPKKKN